MSPHEERGTTPFDASESLAAHEPMVRRIARQLRHAALATRVLDEDDLRAEGRIAVLEALDRYRERSGTSADTWVAVRVRQRMIDALRRHGSRSRKTADRDTTGGATLVTFDDAHPRVSQFEEPELPEGALDETITRQQRRRLQRAIQRLPDRQQRALTLTLLEGMRPRHVSEVMGISPARVSQLQKRAVVTVRRVMRQRCCMSIPPASPREKVIR